MFFCDQCGYLFNITKDVRGKQIGGEINNALNTLIDKFENNESILENDIKNIKSNDLMGNDRYEMMTNKKQKKLISQIKSIDKSFFIESDNDKVETNNTAFFVCKFCKNYKKIPPNTTLYIKHYENSNDIEQQNYENQIYDQTLPRTRNYICINDQCESHKKNTIKEAVITKNATGKVIYICTLCLHYW